MKKYNLKPQIQKYDEKFDKIEDTFHELLEIFQDTARFGCIRINDVSIRFSMYSFSSDHTTLFLTDENGKGIAIIHLENIISVE